MQDYNKEPTELDQALAVIQICKDLLEHKKRDTKFLFIALMVSLAMNLAIVTAFLWYESGWEEKAVETITTEQSVDGEGNIVNGDQINGDQYNDQSQNNSGGND